MTHCPDNGVEFFDYESYSRSCAEKGQEINEVIYDLCFKTRASCAAVHGVLTERNPLLYTGNWFAGVAISDRLVSDGIAAEILQRKARGEAVACR